MRVGVTWFFKRGGFYICALSSPIAFGDPDFVLVFVNALCA